MTFFFFVGTLLSGLSILCFLSIVNLFVGAQFIFQVKRITSLFIITMYLVRLAYLLTDYS